MVIVQLLCHVIFFANPWTAQHASFPCHSPSPRACSNISIESVMTSNYLILCHPLNFLPLIFPSIRIFSNKLAHCIRWIKYWSFSFNISLCNEHSEFISWGLTGLSKSSPNDSQESSPSSLFKSFNSWLSAFLWSNTHIHTLLLEKS